MLTYFPKMKIAAYAIGCGIPVGLALVFWFGFGGTIGVGAFGMAVLALLVIMPAATFNVFNKRADKRFESTLGLYNDECDPQAFVDASADIVSRMHDPYQPLEAWYLSFYALALLDVGRKEDAVRIGQTMQENASSSDNPDEKLSILVNILPLVMRLFGPEAGLRVIAQAQAIIEANPTPNSADQANYLESQRRMIQAVVDHDAEYIIERCTQIRTNASGVQQMRVRVLEAEKEARVREALGDASGARECWQFIAENGNKLPCVEEAKKHV